MGIFSYIYYDMGLIIGVIILIIDIVIIEGYLYIKKSELNFSMTKEEE